MDYTNNSASEAMENTPKLVQDLASVPPVAWPVGAVLLMAAAGTLPFWLAGVAVAGIFLAKHIIAKDAALKEAKARAAVYANICGPVVVCSLSPEETTGEVQARAEKWKEQLKMSGNPYADKIPVVVFPFQPMLYPVGQLSIGWNIYQKEVSEKQHTANLEWYERGCPAHLRATFASAVLPAPKTEVV